MHTVPTLTWATWVGYRSAYQEKAHQHPHSLTSLLFTPCSSLSSHQASSSLSPEPAMHAQISDSAISTAWDVLPLEIHFPDSLIQATASPSTLLVLLCCLGLSVYPELFISPGRTCAPQGQRFFSFWFNYISQALRTRPGTW